MKPQLFAFVLIVAPAAFALVSSCATSEAALESGARCSLNSDCKTPLVCAFERCRSECVTSRDCNGKLCVRSEGDLKGGNVCQLQDEAECTHNSQCPGTQVCGPDRRCRDACTTDKDCVRELLCASRVCAKVEELEDGKLPSRTDDAGPGCTYASDCPGDLVCLDGRCDVECLGDKDCPTAWTCNPVASGGDGRCYPKVYAPADAAVDGPSVDAQETGDAGDGGPPQGLIVRRVGAGKYHSCAVLPNDRMKCWGKGDDGELGIGDPAARGDTAGEMGDALPYADVGTGRSVKSIGIGGLMSCAILDNLGLKCWGQNAGGQLGLGDTASRGDVPGEMGDALPYVNLGTGRTAKFVTLGLVHSCAILDNDRVKCWGTNGSGALGLGDTANRGDAAGEMGDALPYVDLGTGRTAKALAALDLSTCALLDNDRVKCWGSNTYGQLGLGDVQHRGDGPGEMGDALPYGELGTGRSAKAIVASRYFACAILNSDLVKCWGSNSNGDLGLGDTANRGDGAGQMGDALPYVSVGAGRTVKGVFPGGAHTCVILDNDRVKCWGSNSFGQLGLGDTLMRGNGPGQMGDVLPYTDLGTGRTCKSMFATEGSTCALLDNDGIKCWGRNNYGQLGLGDTADRGSGAGQMVDALPFVKLVGP